MSRFSHLETGSNRPQLPHQPDPLEEKVDAEEEQEGEDQESRSARVELGNPGEAGTRPATPPPKPLQPARFGDPAAEAAEALSEAEDAFYSGLWDEALRYYSRALKADPTMVRPWVGQVYALLRKRQDNESLTWVNRALDRFPEDPSLLSTRGVVYAKKGMHQRAIGQSDFALAQGHTRDAWLARGEILLAANSGNADACFSKALEFDPEGARTKAHIGLAYSDARKYAGAYEHFKQAAESWPDNAWLQMQWALNAERLRHGNEARQAIARAYELDPDRREIRQVFERITQTNPISRFMRRLRGD